MNYTKFYMIIICAFTLLCVCHISRASGVTVVGNLSRQAALKPGEKSEGKIQLQNTSSEPQTIKTYKVDYIRSADGVSVYKDPGIVSRSNSTWITFTPNVITIQPKDIAYIYYTVQVPQDPKLAGTYMSVLMVENVAKNSLEPPTKETNKISVGIQTVMRYAIQMITDIGDTGTREIKFIANQLIVHDAQKTLQVDIENTGERGLSLNVSAQVYDVDGNSVGSYQGGRLRIFFGWSRRFNIDLSKLPKGSYRILILADNGDDNVFGKQSNLDIP